MSDPANLTDAKKTQRAIDASLHLLAQFADGIAKTSTALMILLEHAEQERKNLTALLRRP